jgi:hypothetical protein
MRLVLIGIALMLIGLWIPVYLGRMRAQGNARSFKDRISTLVTLIGFAELLAAVSP